MPKVRSDISPCFSLSKFILTTISSRISITVFQFLLGRLIVETLCDTRIWSVRAHLPWGCYQPYSAPVGSRGSSAITSCGKGHGNITSTGPDRTIQQSVGQADVAGESEPQSLLLQRALPKLSSVLESSREAVLHQSQRLVSSPESRLESNL